MQLTDREIDVDTFAQTDESFAVDDTNIETSDQATQLDETQVETF